MLKGRVEMKEAFKKNREKLLNRIEMALEWRKNL